MPLPSQNRSFGTRSSGRRKNGPPAVIFIVPAVLLGLVGLWWALGGADPKEPASASASETGMPGDESLASEASSLLKPADEPVRYAPPPVGNERVRESAALDRTAREGVRPGIDRSPSASLTGVVDDESAWETVQEAAPTQRQTQRQTQYQADDLPQTDPYQRMASTSDVMAQAAEHLNRGELVSARSVLNDALQSDRTSEAEDRQIRAELTTINQELFFGQTAYPGDHLSEIYEIQPGDTLARIARDQSLTVDWRLIQRINRIQNPSRIRVGQKIKLVRGPIHVVVTKSNYRLDLYAGPPSMESEWTFLGSFPVGLGEDNSTPVGEFIVRSDSKLINPVWRNPRTGEFFAADNPENPIGERWIGIEGVGAAAAHEGYGIHGTIDPDSIGTDASMGCVRLNDDAVAVVYEMLVEQVSRVIVKP